jgi:hypothetical protein
MTKATVIMGPHYSVREVNGRPGLAFWNGEMWELDETCVSVNELLEYGLVDREALLGWIQMMPFSSH